MIQEINIYNRENQPIQKMCVLFQNKIKLIKLKKREDNHYQDEER